MHDSLARALSCAAVQAAQGRGAAAALWRHPAGGAGRAAAPQGSLLLHVRRRLPGLHRRLPRRAGAARGSHTRRRSSALQLLYALYTWPHAVSVPSLPPRSRPIPCVCLLTFSRIQCTRCILLLPPGRAEQALPLGTCRPYASQLCLLAAAAHSSFPAYLLTRVMLSAAVAWRCIWQPVGHGHGWDQVGKTVSRGNGSVVMCGMHEHSTATGAVQWAWCRLLHPFGAASASRWAGSAKLCGRGRAAARVQCQPYCKGGGACWRPRGDAIRTTCTHD